LAHRIAVKSSCTIRYWAKQHLAPVSAIYSGKRAQAKLAACETKCNRRIYVYSIFKKQSFRAPKLATVMALAIVAAALGSVTQTASAKGIVAKANADPLHPHLVGNVRPPSPAAPAAVSVVQALAAKVEQEKAEAHAKWLVAFQAAQAEAAKTDALANSTGSVALGSRGKDGIAPGSGSPTCSTLWEDNFKPHRQCADPTLLVYTWPCGIKSNQVPHVEDFVGTFSCGSSATQSQIDNQAFANPMQYIDYGFHR
jgi:hypothetical protein